MEQEKYDVVVYNVGEGVSPFGQNATTGAVASARQVAELIKRGVKPGKAKEVP